MPKRRKTPARKVARAQPSAAVRLALAQANAAIRRGRWAEAHAALLGPARDHPDDAAVQSAFLNVCHRLRDGQGYLSAARRLAALDPDDAELALSLAGAYLTNGYALLATRAFQEWVRRWPDHPRTAAAKAQLRAMEAGAGHLLDELGLTGDDAHEIATAHEESRLLLESGQYAEARAVAERLLERRPDFVPTLNNLSQLLALGGHRDQATEVAERVLTIEPDNLHALSNLTRYHLFAGRIDESRRWAERLKAVESDRTDAGTKKAEALSYLGDDQGVIDAFEAADRAGHLKPPFGDAYLCHWAAVAACRLGQTDQARRLWQRALKLDPNVAFVRENQADLRKPIGDRHAPWPFDLSHWIAGSSLGELTSEVGAALARPGDDEAIKRTIESHLRERPETAALVPLLLDHGDPHGRELALLLASTARTPELVAALRDFGLGQRGPDSLRQRALAVAQEEAVLPEGPLRVWLEGEWRDVQTFGFEIHSDYLQRHPPEVEELAGNALAALRRGDATAGEKILLKALELAPDAPDLLNNLGTAYSAQGRLDEAEAIARRLYREFPDYFFGQIGQARLLLNEGKLDEATEILTRLMARERFHVSEFCALAAAQIDLSLAREQPESASYWLDLWEETDPDHPALPAARHRVDLLHTLKGLDALTRRRRR